MMVDNSIYQYMFDEISKYLLNDWERAVVYLEYGQNSYSITFMKSAMGNISIAIIFPKFLNAILN